MEQHCIIPGDKYVFIDIDGTLVDSAYQVNCYDLQNQVDRLQGEGWRVGLSSDTPLEGMRIWSERFGMNGPLIAEKGAIVQYEGVECYVHERTSSLGESREEIIGELSDRVDVVWRGNPVEALLRQEEIAAPGEVVLLVNEFRQCSLSYFIRFAGETGGLAIVPELTDELTMATRERFSGEEYDIDLNHESGIIIVSLASVSKRVGTLACMDVIGLDQVGMIGNSMTDYIGQDIACHYAVANASAEFKTVADYTASEPLTRGVRQILGKLST